MTTLFPCLQCEEGGMRSTRRVIYTEARVCFTKMVTECSRSTEVFGATPSDPRSVSGPPARSPQSNRSGQSGSGTGEGEGRSRRTKVLSALMDASGGGDVAVFHPSAV